MRNPLLAFLVVASCLFACSSSEYPSPRALHARGSTDLTCNSEALSSDPIDPRTRVVRGCGRVATYVEECQMCGSRINRHWCNCTWRIDGGVH